ncbi:MAG: hypothetical protein JJU11_11310, partial [Candidatus Sumerlaeia bacterium]|nr:hypothetical protein [Candidatus Sumerlaeia bacterium]
QVDLVVNGRPRSIMLLPDGWNQIRIPGGRFQRGAIIEISIPNPHHVEEGPARVMGVAIKLNGAGNLY